MSKAPRKTTPFSGLTDIPFLSDLKIKRPSLEKLGISYFRRASQKTNAAQDEVTVHLITPDEIREMDRIQRRAMINAGLAGAFSATCSAITSMSFYHLIDESTHQVSTDDTMKFWLWVITATVVVTAIELAYLYFDALKATLKLAQVANIPLFPKGKEASAMAGALARAALELPNPTTTDVNINPTRESSRLRVFLAPLIYKAKITVTNFLAKLLLRRLVGRAAARAYVELIAIPISALWNVWVTRNVMRQARLRALGPSFALEFTNRLLHAYPTLSAPAKAEMLRAVGTAVVRSENFHPNLEYLVYILMQRLPLEEVGELDNSALFIDGFRQLSTTEQEAILQLFIVATVLDGRVKVRELGTLRKAYAIAGFTFELEPIQHLVKQFYRGAEIQLPIVPLSRK